MSRWGDERAVTVQIGAILLLAILVAALSLYQVNAVPQQNSESEFAHHQEVSGELLELRDTVGRADTRHQRGVPITLGTQYQTRIAAINPPAPAGTIRTSDRKNVTIEHASVDDETVQGILETPPTTRFIEYEPGYNEYDAPTTVIEHSLLYNEFGDANVTVEEQTMIGEDSLTLVFLDGDLSRTASGRVSVSVETIGGPTAERMLTRDDGSDGNVTITLPTRSPERWNESIGTSFDEGQTNARVISEESQNVTIELAGDEYELRMAQVSVGSGAQRAKLFDKARADDGESEQESGSGTFATDWNQSAIGGEDGMSCDGESDADCTFDLGSGNSVDLTVQLSREIESVSVDYGLESADVSSLSPTSGETDSTGSHTTTVTFSDEASDGDEITVHATSGGGGDELTILLEEATGTVTGVVTDEGGDPIDDATVTVESTDQSEITSADGEYTIEDVPTGGQEITADAEEYVTETASVTVTDGETTMQDFTLESSDGSEEGQADTIDPIESSATTAGDNIVFEVENTGDDSVTAINASIDTGLADSFNNGQDPEMIIIGGIRDDPGQGQDLMADGTRYELDSNGELASQSSDTVEFHGFDSDTFSGIELTDDPADADIVITIGFEDGSEFEIYLEEV